LEACSAFGETPGEALTEVERAKKAWLQTAQAGGDDAGNKPFIADAAWENGTASTRSASG